MLFLVPSLRRAGAETQIVDLVNALDATRFDKHLVFFEAQRDQLHRVDLTSVKVHRLERHRKLDLSLARRLAALIDENDIEIVHCTLQISLFFAYLARFKSKARPRLIAAIHTTLNRSRRDEMYDRLLHRYLLRRCDRVLFVCQAQARHWVEKYPELQPLAAVVYNGVDPALHDAAALAPAGVELRHELGIAPTAHVIACIAGLRPEKGHGFLLEAFAALGGAPCLLLAGDGPERARIESMAARLGLEDRIALLGEVADARRVIAAADLTVLSSVAVETFSMAMLESMAMAVPVVATNIGGLSEAIEPGCTGDLVAPGDVPALTRALQRMLDDDAARRAMGLQAQARVRSNFSLRAMAEATAALLDPLTEAGARGSRDSGRAK